MPASRRKRRKRAMPRSSAAPTKPLWSALKRGRPLIPRQDCEASMRQNARPRQLFKNLNAKIASIPMILTAMCVFVGGTIWTVVYSFTNSKLLPRLNFVGLDQYHRLWTTPRWLISIENLAVYGILSLIFSLVIGFVL